jgi:formate hydrogenlyase subunit 6/NADH:ubiquinone oxidoreductase subunit I
MAHHDKAHALCKDKCPDAALTPQNKINYAVYGKATINDKQTLKISNFQ